MQVFSSVQRSSTRQVNIVAMDLDEISLDNRPETIHDSESPIAAYTVRLNLEPKRNNQLPGSRTQEGSSNAPPSDTVSPYSRAPAKKLPRRLTCRACSRKVSKSRKCHGESGVSCDNCIIENLKCSLLEPRPFRCKYCSRDYTTEPLLRGHLTSQPSHLPANLDSMDTSVSTPLQSATFISAAVNEIPASPRQQFNASISSTNSIQDHMDGTTPRFGEVEVCQQQRYSNILLEDNCLLTKIPAAQQQTSPQAKQPLKIKANDHNVDTGEAQYGIGYQGRGQKSQQTVISIPMPYNELKFEIFETYAMRNLSPDYVQTTLDGIRDDIKHYGEFLRGNDEGTSTEARERLKFLDEVEPLVSLSEIDNEGFEIFGVQNSRLVVALRSMFAVPDNSRLEEALENLGPSTQLLKLPNIVCGIMAYYLMQLFIERDLHREAELQAIEQTHGSVQAANTVQHARLVAKEGDLFKLRVRNRAKKMAKSLYDLIRPLTHWEQDFLNNGNEKLHLQKLQDIILASLHFAAELDARKGTFRFFWPRSGENFDPKFHIDEEDEDGGGDNSSSKTKPSNQHDREKVIVLTLMPGVSRMLDTELQYAKAAVLVASPRELDRY